jgi:hypothetical protein
MSNGLCYYPPDDFYGRYSCTDPTWDACPDICTYNYTALYATVWPKYVTPYN